MAENANTFPSISPVPFPQARAVALRVLTAPGLAGRAYLQGGLVPWVASGRDSGRPHGDVDISVRLGDMPAVRSWLAAEGLYDPALDSFGLGCNESQGDFGAHAIVDSVLVSFCPLHFEGRDLHQRNAALAATDGFDALLEAVVPGVEEGDLFEGRAAGRRRRRLCHTRGRPRRQGRERARQGRARRHRDRPHRLRPRALRPRRRRLRGHAHRVRGARGVGIGAAPDGAAESGMRTTASKGRAAAAARPFS